MPQPTRQPTTEAVLPPSFATLLDEFKGCFSAWTFPVFYALASGMLAQTARRSVCGMLVGARLSATWSHHRAHRFFSHASWSVEEVSVILARLVVRLVLAADEAVTVAIDDTLFHRRGPKVHAASWFHDGSAPGEAKLGYGNNWVILAIVVRLGALDRPIALPVGFALVRKDSAECSRLALARRLVEALATALPDRKIHVVGDSAYAGKALRGLPASVTWTTRLRSNASLYELPPARTAKRGRPPMKGKKLPKLVALAAGITFAPTTVTRYGKTTTVSTALVQCCWYGVFGPQAVQVVFVRDKSKTGHDVALVSTDLHATAAHIIERYATRWSIEVAIEDAKQLGGVGQARNRVEQAVKRTVPFGLTVNTLAILWYATAGHHPGDVDNARALAPWYRQKARPSVLDMLAKLRRVIIAAQFQRVHSGPVTPQEISVIRLAWKDVPA